ncbi:hypothetical protein AB0L65_14180 [Nonomuraea sp. NPDC052116]|uniref:hypothetical protein n=1 Tax=Nonomuraea sp. NPDC052116 TaxID=3155665 RepID=UPI0034308FF8
MLFYFGTGFSPIPALTWLAPLPMLLLASRASGRATFALAFLAFLAGMTNQLDFFLRTPSVPRPIGIGIIVGCSLLFGLVVWLFRALARRGLIMLAASAPPAVWVALMYLTVLANPTGIIWPLATSVADVPVVTQIASVTGAWGVEYVVMLAPTTLAAVLWPGTVAAARLRTGVVGAAACLLVLVFGTVRLAGADSTGWRLMAAPAADEFGNGRQHSRMGLLRGVETGLSVAWAAQWGTPMISDPWGRVLAERDTEGTRQPFVTAFADVPSGPGPTVYARFGDWFAWLCLALAAAGLVALRSVPRQPGRGVGGQGAVLQGAAGQEEAARG